MARNVHKDEVSLINIPSDAIAEDRGLRFCAVPQLILISHDDAAYYKNDRTAIAYKFDSMDVVLEKDGYDHEAPGVEVSFPWQSDAVGYIIDWRQLENYGCYRVRIDWVLGGNSGSFYYGSYNVLEYTPFNARGTVRLFVVLNDVVRRHGINYRDSGYAGTVRFKGIFGYMQPNYDAENIVYADRSRHKVRIEALRSYELHTNQLLECMTRLIDEDTLLAANQIYVTDHNATNHRQDFYDFPVVLSDTESPVFKYNEGPLASLTAVFLDKVAAHESKYDGDIKGSDNLILSLPTVVNNPTPCEDGTAVLKDTSGDVLSSTPVPSGVTVPITAPDGDISINSTPLTTVESGGAKNIIVHNSLGDSYTVGAENAGHWQIGDSLILINGNSLVALPAESPLDIALLNSIGTPIGTIMAVDYVLVPDTTINVYVDGVLQTTQTVPTLEDETINIIWT